MIPSVSNTTLSSQAEASTVVSHDSSRSSNGPPRLVIPSVRQTVSSNTRMSNKKPQDSSVPVTPNDHRPANTSTASQQLSHQERVGRWSDHEHTVFLEGLQKYGKQWKTIANMIGTRTVVQVRTHAQKYFMKAQKVKGDGNAKVTLVQHYTHAVKKTKQRKSVARSKQQTKQIITLESTTEAPAAVARKVSLGSVSPPPQDIYANSSLGFSSTATSSENLSTISPIGVNELDLLEPTWSTDAMFLQDGDLDVDHQDPLEWLIDGGMQHLPESSLAAAPMFPEFGSDDLSSDIHLLPNSSPVDKPMVAPPALEANNNNDMLDVPLYNMNVQSLFLGETA